MDQLIRRANAAISNAAYEGDSYDVSDELGQAYGLGQEELVAYLEEGHSLAEAKAHFDIW